MNADLTAHDLVSAVDSLVTELFAEAGIDRPPIDALGLARRSGVAVVINPRQQARARCKSVSERRMIILRPDDRPERLQWAAAHEIGELLAPTIFERLRVSSDEICPASREQLANLFASRALLPTAWFAADARRLRCDLPSLKNVYPTASHELIAWRLLDLDQAAIVTIFDHDRLTRRRGNFPTRSFALHPAEIECQQEAHRLGTSAKRDCPPQGRLPRLCARAWPIHEAVWKREIVLATVYPLD